MHPKTAPYSTQLNAPRRAVSAYGEHQVGVQADAPDQRPAAHKQRRCSHVGCVVVEGQRERPRDADGGGGGALVDRLGGGGGAKAG